MQCRTVFWIMQQLSLQCSTSIIVLYQILDSTLLTWCKLVTPSQQEMLLHVHWQPLCYQLWFCVPSCLAILLYGNFHLSYKLVVCKLSARLAHSKKFDCLCIYSFLFWWLSCYLFQVDCQTLQMLLASIRQQSDSQRTVQAIVLD